MYKRELKRDGKTVTIQITEVDERMRDMDGFVASNGFEISSALFPAIGNDYVVIYGSWSKDDNAVRAITSSTERQAIALEQDIIEAEAELAKLFPDVGWNDRCAKGEWYYCIKSIGTIGKSRDIRCKIDRDRYDHCNYFPCSQFTEKELVNNGISDMSLIQVKAFKYGKSVGDWMGEEDRFNDEIAGYYVRFSEEHFKVDNYGAFYFCKWFTKDQTAKDFAKIANNENWDYMGRVKG